MDKPTVEQVAWVFKKIMDSAKGSGTFRYLIYERMGFGMDSYLPLYEAGGMAINNAMAQYFDEDVTENDSSVSD